MRVHVEGLFDFRAHRVGPRLGAAHGNLERGPAWVDALGAKFIKNCKHIAWCDQDDVGTEIVDQPHLPLGHAARHRHHSAAEPLGAVVQTKPAGKQPVAVASSAPACRAAAARTHRAGHDAGPRVESRAAVADHGRLAGGAGRGMDAADLVARHREHPERIILAQVVFGGEREPWQVIECLEVVRMHAGFVEGVVVVRDIAVGVAERPFQALELQGRDLVTRGGLDRLEAFACGVRLMPLSGRRGIQIPSVTKQLTIRFFAARRSSAFRDWRSAPG